MAVNTTQNRATVLAMMLRAAMASIRKVAMESCFCVRCLEARDQALGEVDNVAEELEEISKRPLTTIEAVDLAIRLLSPHANNATRAESIYADVSLAVRVLKGQPQ